MISFEEVDINPLVLWIAVRHFTRLSILRMTKPRAKTSIIRNREILTRCCRPRSCSRVRHDVTVESADSSSSTYGLVYEMREITACSAFSSQKAVTTSVKTLQSGVTSKFLSRQPVWKPTTPVTQICAQGTEWHANFDRTTPVNQSHACTSRMSKENRDVGWLLGPILHTTTLSLFGVLRPRALKELYSVPLVIQHSRSASSHQ